MPLICGGIVPHAPLLLREVSGPKVSSRAAEVRSAFRLFQPGGGWDLTPAEILVIASPHGAATGIHASIEGSLGGFGPGLPGLRADGDASAALILASGSSLSLLEGPVDHGVTVPLLLLGSDEGNVHELPPVVACVQAEDDDASAFAAAVAEATQKLADERSVAFLASAHTSAGLTPRAPLTELDAAKDLDTQILETLSSDVGGLTTIPADRWVAAGSCGAGPLLALAKLYSGRTVEVAAYDAPYGVGYLVAGVTPS